MPVSLKNGKFARGILKFISFSYNICVLYFYRDVVIPKSMVVNDNRHRTPDKKELDNSSEGDETDDVFYDIEDDPDEDLNEDGKEAVA